MLAVMMSNGCAEDVEAMSRTNSAVNGDIVMRVL